MAQVLVVDWDEREARYVVGDIAGRRVTVRALGADELPAHGDAAPEVVTDWLRRVRKEHALGRTRLLVAVPRSSVELLDLSLPPATDAELPELVANQALQESALIAEDAVVDYVPLDDDPTVPRHVAVAALPHDQRDGLLQCCENAGLRPHRLLLRSWTAMSLFGAVVRADRLCLAVCPSGQEVEVNVLADGRMAFSRTVRLPEQATEQEISDRLLAEINRTRIAAPRERFGDDTIARVHLVGSREQYAGLAERIEQETGLPTDVLDPFAAAQVTELQMPVRPERFAPLLGLLLDEAAGSHAVDFLNPRRAVRPLSRWRLAGVVAGVVALVVLAATAYVWTTLAEISETNRQLGQRLRELRDTARKATNQKRRLEAIGGWQDRDVNWLDELRDLSERFPGPRDALVLRMTLRHASSASGAIDLQGLLRDPKIVVNMERQVRDAFRRVQSRRVQQRPGEEDYSWFFETAISVAPRARDQYTARDEPAVSEPAPEATAAAPEETPTPPP
jgi:Tfp pilus assembly PilM family ATPase